MEWAVPIPSSVRPAARCDCSPNGGQRRIGRASEHALRRRQRRSATVVAGYDVCMPVVFRYRGFRFFFYSNEGSPREPVHVHVMGEGGEAKFWLRPVVQVACSDGLSARILNELSRVVEQNGPLIERSWNECFG